MQISGRMTKRLLAGWMAALLLAAPAAAAGPERADGEAASETAGSGGYAAYLAEHAGAARPAEEIRVEGTAYQAEDGQGLRPEADGVYTDEDSVVRFVLPVAQPGLYCLEIGYRTVKGRGASIQRQLMVNGAVPYEQAENISLSRVFRDEGRGAVDSRGNQFRPEQVEELVSRTEPVRDSEGYIASPLQFYLQAGKNVLTLTAIREPVVITHIRAYNPKEMPSYDSVRREYEVKGYKHAPKGATVRIQGEDAAFKSDTTLYPVNDRTSPLTDPADVRRMVLNTIGGVNWRRPGQWLSWTVEVEESGLYQLGMRFKQNFSEGQASCRRLLIDGKVPFAEAETLQFTFSNGWQLQMLGGDEPYLFYFEKGRTYTLTLENTLGELAEVLEQTRESAVSLNDVYRQFKTIVGTTPDANRDYGLAKQLPACMDTLRRESEKLRGLAGRLEELTGGKSSHYGMVQKLFVQLDSFLADDGTIPASLSSFSSNISNLANLSLTAVEQPLTLDYLLIQASEDEIPRYRESFFEKVWFELSAFSASFVSDYSVIGDFTQGSEQVTLWLTSGRDQSQVVKQLADNYFTRDTGVSVNVRLVTMDGILPAVASGKGPDVAIGQEKALPVRYGMRGALLDLNQFADASEALGAFSPSAAASFILEDKLYALPDTQDFLLMYVRDDVLDSLGMEPPDTWEDLYNHMFDLHQNNLDIGLPSITDDTLDVFYMLLFQRDGALYNDDLSATRLDEPEGIAAFQEWSELYTKYKVTEKMDLLTRFRMGDAPIVITMVSFYNKLALSAPEIQGQWSVHPVPGTRREDGTVVRSIGSTPTGSVIFRNAANPQACWQFLKWWTSAEIQQKYSQEMENLQGASGRVITANLEAFDALPWPREDAAVMREQRAFIQGVPEIAGSYVVDRYLCTGIRYAIKNGGSAREILLDWNKKINVENQIRRKEFGLGQTDG